MAACLVGLARIATDPIDDTIFAFGTLAMGWFVVGLKIGWLPTREEGPFFHTLVLLPEQGR